MIQLSGYRIEREIGRGGMATVYLAIQKNLARKVALKVIAPHLATDTDFRTRFLNEARLVARLGHPGIPAIHDIGDEGGHLYLSMEYLPGGDLKTLLRNGAMRAQDALSVFRKLLLALEYAHRSGIVHRDVKPENVLFQKDGRPMLTDFGIAIAAGKTDTSDQNSTGLSVGTPRYMSPEQIQGLPVDGRSDLYSLGAVFFEMLTGRPPYKGRKARALVSQHLTAPIPRLPSALRGYQRIINRTLAKKPDQRYPHAEALLRDLDRIPPPPPKPDAKNRRRPKRTGGSILAWTLGGTLLSLLLLCGAWYWKQSARPRPSMGGGGGLPSMAISPKTGSPSIHSGSPAAGTMPNRPDKGKAKPWLQVSIPSTPLAARPGQVLPLALEKLVDLPFKVDGFEIDSGQKGGFRLTMAFPGTGYDVNGRRDQPYLELVGRLDPGLRPQIYGYLVLRPPDQARRRSALRGLSGIRPMAFDLTLGTRRILRGTIQSPGLTLGEGSEGLILKSLRIDLENFPYRGLMQGGRFNLTAKGIEITKKRERIYLGSVSANVALPDQDFFSGWHARLRWDDLKIRKDSEVAWNVGNGFYQVVPESTAPDRVALSARLQMDSLKLVMDRNPPQSWKHLAMTLSMDGPRRELEQMVALVDRQSLVSKEGRSRADKRYRARVVQTLLPKILGGGLRVKKGRVTLRSASEAIDVSLNCQWPSAVAYLAGRQGGVERALEATEFSMRAAGSKRLLQQMGDVIGFAPLLKQLTERGVLPAGSPGPIRLEISIKNGRLTANGMGLDL